MRLSPELHASGDREAAQEDLDLIHLSLGELLVIWALRARLARGPRGPVPGFRLAFGLSGVEAARASFEALFGILQRHCRPDLGVHALGCRCVSADEMTLAGMIAALQAGAVLHAHALATRLVDATVLDGLLDHGCGLAMSLKAERLYLPLRPLAGCDSGRRSSIH